LIGALGVRYPEPAWRPNSVRAQCLYRHRIMPDPERLLSTLQRAAQCFRATPGRRGRVVHLEAAQEVLVVGDLHGNLENFRLLLGIADLGHNAGRYLVLQEVIHGPHYYPAGGDKSHQLLDLTAALKCQYPHQVHFLLGNHELAQATARRISKTELDLNQTFREGVASAYGPLAVNIYTAYQSLFAVAPVVLHTPNRVLLSHSLPPGARLPEFDPIALEREESTEADLLPGGSVHMVVWGRDTRRENVAAFLKLMDADLLVTGHIPCDRGFDLPNDLQLILDCAGTPGGYCLFPCDRPLTHEELVSYVSTL
jgi:hypothetical protein